MVKFIEVLEESKPRVRSSNTGLLDVSIGRTIEGILDHLCSNWSEVDDEETKSFKDKLEKACMKMFFFFNDKVRLMIPIVLTLLDPSQDGPSDHVKYAQP